MAFGPAPEVPAPLVSQPAGAVEASVHRIVDGDTFDVLMPGGIAQRVRLLLVDTPELGRNEQQLECYADEATAVLRDLLPPTSTVFLWLDAQPFDRYERLLAHAWGPNGRWVNGQLLVEGAGRVLMVPPNRTFLSDAERLERKARDDNIGLWGACA